MTDINKTILVADDTAFFRKVTKDVLENAGYTVLTAESSEKAAAMIEQYPAELSLVIIDLMMADGAGFEVVRKMRERKEGREVSVIAVTGVYKQEADRQELEDLGVDGYITNSTPPEEIVFHVNKLLFPRHRDSRKSRRSTANLLLEYRVLDSVFHAYLYTISEGGLFIRTTNIKPVGTSLDLAFRLPGREDMIIARGEVVHVKLPENGGSSKIHPPGMGVRFTSLSPIDREAVTEYVDKKSLENIGRDGEDYR